MKCFEHCRAVVVEDARVHPTSKLSIQPPRDEFIIQHLFPDKASLQFV
jgi:hypothetical protein